MDSPASVRIVYGSAPASPASAGYVESGWQRRMRGRAAMLGTQAPASTPASSTCSLPQEQQQQQRRVISFLSVLPPRRRRQR